MQKHPAYRMSGVSLSKHRSCDLENHPTQSLMPWPSFEKLGRNRFTQHDRTFDIFIHVLDCRGAIKDDRIFEVKIERTVIHVNRPDDRDMIVADEHFGMDESGGVFIDFHPGFKEFVIVRPRNEEHALLVGDVGSHDSNIHSALGGDLQSGQHLIVQHKVGGRDIDVAFGHVDHLDIRVLRYVVTIKGIVPEGLDEAVGLRRNRWLIQGELFGDSR